MQCNDWLQHHGAHAAHGQVSEQEQSPGSLPQLEVTGVGSPGEWARRYECQRPDSRSLSFVPGEDQVLTGLFAHKASPGRTDCCKIRSLF